MNSGSIGMAKFSLLELVHPQQGETFQPGHPTNIKKWFSNRSAVRLPRCFFHSFLDSNLLGANKWPEILGTMQTIYQKNHSKTKKKFYSLWYLPKTELYCKN